MSIARTFTLGTLGLVALGCTIAQPTMPPAGDAGEETMNVSALGDRRAAPASGSAPGTGARPAAPPADATAAAPIVATPDPGATTALTAPSSTLAPLVAPTTGLPAATATPGLGDPLATAAPNPFGMPAPLLLPLPKPLEALGFAGLIGNHGSGVISNNGGRLVPLTKLISDYGGGYRLAASLPSIVAATKLKGNLTSLIYQMKATNELLLAAAQAGLQPDQPRVIPNPDGTTRTAVLTLARTHATLSIYEGATPEPAARIATISYTKPTRVRAAVALPPGLTNGLRSRWVEEYDLEAGIVVADGAFEVATLTPGVVEVLVGRYELMPPGPGEPAGTAYTFRNPVIARKPGDTQAPRRTLFATNFLESGHAASWYKTGHGGPGGELALFPADGFSFGQTPPAPYAVFMGPDGQALDLAEASAELKAIVPAIDAAVPSFPSDPGSGDPFAAPELAFLD